MTSQLTAKIRLVMCPRCRKVLPELSNVPVYQCGGCDAVLQVKKRKNGSNETGLHIQEAEISQKNEVQHDSKGDHLVNEIIDTVHKETKASSDHQSEDMNCFSSGRESFEPAMDEADDDDKFLKKQIIGDKVSEGLSSPDEFNSSTEFGHHESEDTSPISIASCELQNNYHQDKEPSPVDESRDKNEVSRSNELTCQEIEDLSPETGTSGDFDEDAISHYIFGNFKMKKLPALDPVDSVIAPQKLSRESTLTQSLSPPHVEQLEQSRITEATVVENIIFAETSETKDSNINQNSENQVFPPNELTCQELEDSSPVLATECELEENSISRYIFGNLTPGGSVINSPKLSGESRLEESPISPHDQQMKPPQLEEPNRSDSISSEENLEKVVFNNVDSTHRSSGAYDGSVSSLVETGDQEYLRLLKGKYIKAESPQVSSLPTSRNPDSNVREKNSYVTKGFVHSQFETPEYRRPVRSRIPAQRDNRLSRAHFRPRFPPFGYEYGASSNLPGKESKFSLRPEYREEERLKLIKLLLELQDQLKRPHTPRNGVKHVPPCYHASSELDMCHDLRYSDRCYQRGALSNQCKFSRIPFSAEAAVNRPQLGHSCLQFSPHEWHCSAPISTHIYSNPNQCSNHGNCNNTNIRCPCSDVPIINHKRERKNAIKRHVLPVKGGAPFVVCDNCSKLLQLPGDFLIFRKRYHQLRCSSCSYVLKFSLRNGYKLDRYVVGDELDDLAPAPPPSEVGDLREMSKGKKMSYGGGNCSHVDPVCFSDDYGPSICKSCSTETEPIFVVIPFDVQRRESKGKNIISSGYIDHQNLRKDQSVLKESQNIKKDTISKAEKASPVVERVRGRDVSPLHRLMGYDSAREVLKG